VSERLERITRVLEAWTPVEDLLRRFGRRGLHDRETASAARPKLARTVADGRLRTENLTLTNG
jgi:hypothetical protein